MDFMKVLDQTVREIKREVNMKVLKVPEIEQKVLDATSNEPWGPHGTALAEIAQATKIFVDCQMVMNVLWTRLTDSGRNWRHVYKALAVIEYLVANGSERAVDDILEHTFQISSLASFEFVEPNGKDMGINVRKKVEAIMGLLNNKDKIQEVRNKAAVNRDKYVGLSSTGITHKSSSASYGGFQSGSYGGFGNSKEDVHKDGDNYGGDSNWSSFDKPQTGKGFSGEKERMNANDEPKQHVSASKVSYADDNYGPAATEHSGVAPGIDEDEFDDFDPRGTSKSGTTGQETQQPNLFGESLIDFMDAPPSATTEPSNSNISTEVDLFADATFVSAPIHAEAAAGSSNQSSVGVDLFAQQSTGPTLSSSIDFFAAPAPSIPSASKSPQLEPMNPSMVDPFAAVPLNAFDVSASFGDFTPSTEPTKNSTESGEVKSSGQKSSAESRAQQKKDTFQVKSGIWADSLSRGLIDLNITAPKKVSLADIGIVGGLSDGVDEKVPPASMYMGRTVGMGPSSSGMGFSNVGQYQLGSFK